MQWHNQYIKLPEAIRTTRAQAADTTKQPTKTQTLAARHTHIAGISWTRHLVAVHLDMVEKDINPDWNQVVSWRMLGSHWSNVCQIYLKQLTTSTHQTAVPLWLVLFSMGFFKPVLVPVLPTKKPAVAVPITALIPSNYAAQSDVKL